MIGREADPSFLKVVFTCLGSYKLLCFLDLTYFEA